MKTGHFSLKNLIADFVLFTNQTKNSIYDLSTISTYFKSSDKVDTLLIKLINNQNNTKSYQKFILEAMSMPSNPDNHYALQTFATGSDSYTDVLAFIKASKEYLDGIILPLALGYRSNSLRASLISDSVAAIAAANNLVQFSNLTYLMSILSSGSKLNIPAKDVQQYLSTLLQVNHKEYTKEE